jgi:hypothetical protein
MTDYTIEDALNIIESLKDNPYGINFIRHFYFRSKLRDITEDEITIKINTETPVEIHKTKNYDNRFGLTYEFDKTKDLYIFIDIEDIDRINIITIYLDKCKRFENG